MGNANIVMIFLMLNDGSLYQCTTGVTIVHIGTPILTNRYTGMYIWYAYCVHRCTYSHMGVPIKHVSMYTCGCVYLSRCSVGASC